jgi:flagellar basal-body rod protein FlgC
MFSPLDISTSGLVAQRLRMNAISSNLANISTTHNERGEAAPYQARFVIFQADESVSGESSAGAGAAGVAVSSVETDTSPPQLRYEPGHPDAITSGPSQGYVAYPNVNMMAELTDAMEASRAYEANLGAMEISKNLDQQTLRILA